MTVRMRPAVPRINTNASAPAAQNPVRVPWRAVFGISSSSCTFSIAPFAEDWEYESLPSSTQT